MQNDKFQSFIEEVKSKNDIVDVVSLYCNLKRQGGDYWACCPLPGHIEKTPSFHVNPVGQFYKCFGCQKGGNVINFIMEVENLPFYEAVKFLAQRANLKMPDNTDFDEKKADEQYKQKQKRLSLLKDTAKFYVKNLAKPEGKQYIEYMLKRGFTTETITAYGIGCSLDYDSLPKHLSSLGYSYEDMLATGVVSYNEEHKSYSDFEAKRLVVPIIDSFDNVIAFGGRVLIPKPDMMKYKNTSNTVIFDKSRSIFNGNQLKLLKRQLGDIPYIIMVEGYMDVIALYACGIKNVAASMGTSLTDEQAKFLLRYTKTVVLSYDGDSAGQKATFRGLQIFKDAGLTVKVVTIPNGMDPDEYVKAMGKDAYLNLIDNALPLIDYKLEYLKGVYNLNDKADRRKYIANALRVINESEDNFEREELLKKLSRDSGITFDALNRDLQSVLLEADKKQKDVKIIEPQRENAVTSAERFILHSIIQNKSYAKLDDIINVELTSDLRKGIVDELIKLSSQDGFAPSLLAERLGPLYYDELTEIFKMSEKIYVSNGYEGYYADCLKTIELSNLESEIATLQAYANTVTEIEELNVVSSELKKRINKRNKLKAEDKNGKS